MLKFLCGLSAATYDERSASSTKEYIWTSAYAVRHDIGDYYIVCPSPTVIQISTFVTRQHNSIVLICNYMNKNGEEERKKCEHNSMVLSNKIHIIDK